MQKASLARTVETLGELEGLRNTLESYRSRTTVGLPDSFWSEVERLRLKGVADENELLANASWCIGEIGTAQDQFIEAYRLMRNDQFYNGWCALENCELALRSLRRHYLGDHARFGLDFMAEMVPRFQSLFPYRIFFSPAYLVEESHCSICGSPLGLDRGCDHQVGEVYWGKQCARVITAAKLLEISAVENPVQKYSVAFAQGSSYNYGAIRYVVRALRSPWHGWTYEKQDIDTGEPLFPGTGRNEQCPCGSGMKYKKCCWGKTRKKHHFLVFFDVPPPPGYPSYLEDARFEVPAEVPGPTVEASQTREGDSKPSPPGSCDGEQGSSWLTSRST